MKAFRMVLYATLIFLVLPADSAVTEQAKKSQVVAKVNGKDILMSDVNFFVDRDLERAKTMGQEITPEIENTIRRQWVEHMISRELLLQQAVTEKAVVSDADVENGLVAAQQKGIALPPNQLRRLI